MRTSIQSISEVEEPVAGDERLGNTQSSQINQNPNQSNIFAGIGTSQGFDGGAEKIPGEIGEDINWIEVQEKARFLGEIGMKLLTPITYELIKEGKGYETDPSEIKRVRALEIASALAGLGSGVLELVSNVSPITKIAVSAGLSAVKLVTKKLAENRGNPGIGLNPGLAMQYT